MEKLVNSKLIDARFLKLFSSYEDTYITDATYALRKDLVVSFACFVLQ